MVFSVSIGFSQLTRSADDPTIYALFVGDTVKVQEVNHHFHRAVHSCTLLLILSISSNLLSQNQLWN